MTGQRKMFGTDGIRGRANVAPMTPEMALKLGQAVTYRLRKEGRSEARVIIGKDTRLSCDMFELAMGAGICSMGGSAIFCGQVPTPAVANLTRSMRADLGVVISASHNPFGDNGIKLFGNDGFKLPDSAEAELERLLSGAAIGTKAEGTGIGRSSHIQDAQGRYIVYAKNTFPRDLNLDGLRIVIDAAHGAAFDVAPHIFSELGAEVFALGVRPNGKNINHACGALHPEVLQKEVLKRKAHLGIALDGDADRLILVDEKGQIVDGDAVMAISAIRLLREKRLAKKTLVATVMSNMGLEQALNSAGGKLLRTGVGDRQVVEAMRKNKLSLGGEQSGHLVFLEHATTGDGCVAALQMLAAMIREQKPMSELAQVMTRVPQLLESIQMKKRLPLSEMPLLSKTIRAAEKKLGKKGRVLVRWSGTEAKLRLMAEGPRLGHLKEMLGDMAAAAAKDLK